MKVPMVKRKLELVRIILAKTLLEFFFCNRCGVAIMVSVLKPQETGFDSD